MLSYFSGIAKAHKSQCFLNIKLPIFTAEFRHDVYAFRKCMHFQSQLDQTEVVFENKGIMKCR